MTGGDQMYNKFAELLEKNNVTAYQVAKATEIATATLTEWKKGTYTPKVDKLKKIADYFGVSVDYFLD
jgi:transcriptional regulator with XRE-family HTH domain